jgi:hypothetical protein
MDADSQHIGCVVVQRVDEMPCRSRVVNLLIVVLLFEKLVDVWMLFSFVSF